MRCPAFSTATRLPGQVLSGGYHGPGGNGNGHRHHGHGGNGHAKKVMKRRKSHMKQGRNRAACAAYGAVLLIQKCGFTIEAAIACTGSTTGYIDAMKWIMASGDESLLDRVLHGQIDIFMAAERVRPLVELKTAYAKLTAGQRIKWAAEENPNRVFEEVIVPASALAREFVFVEEATNGIA